MFSLSLTLDGPDLVYRPLFVCNKARPFWEISSSLIQHRSSAAKQNFKRKERAAGTSRAVPRSFDRSRF